VVFHIIISILGESVLGSTPTMFVVVAQHFEV